jgi:hypothetical protein
VDRETVRGGKRAIGVGRRITGGGRVLLRGLKLLSLRLRGFGKLLKS